MATDVRTIGFVKVIQEQLFAKNEFINMSIDHSEFVNDITVEIPQGGTLPAVQKDRAVLPATISQRTDTKLTYNLAEYTTDPILVVNKDMVELSYNKRASIMKQHTDILNDRLGLETAFQWAGVGASQIVRTTGTATAGIAPPSGTGNRKAVLLDDIANLAKKLDKDHMPAEGRNLLMPSDMYWNMLIENPLLLSKEYNVSDADLARGIVKKIYNFNIILRPSVVVYDNAATPVKKAVGAAAATTDNYGAIAWQEDYVAKALGAIKVFIENDKPEYYGDVMSALIRYAPTILRTNGEGIVTLVQSA